MNRPTNIKEKSALAYIEHLEASLRLYENSPYLESYVTIYNQLKSFNEQLVIEISLDGTVKGKIDLFAEKEDKSFDRTKWYFENILDLNKTLDSLRKLMTPEEVKEIGERKMNAQSTAERHIFKG